MLPRQCYIIHADRHVHGIVSVVVFTSLLCSHHSKKQFITVTGAILDVKEEKKHNSSVCELYSFHIGLNSVRFPQEYMELL